MFFRRNLYEKSAFLPVALAFCILLLAGCTTLSQAQKKYLAEQAFPLQPGSGFPTDAFGDAADYRVFLAGESHDMAASFDMRRDLVRYFHEEQGVRCLLLEEGMGSGLLLEHYLQTGDEALLDYYMEQLRGTFAFSEETAVFWQWLRAYNAGLPSGKKLHVAGVDIDHQQKNAALGISLLVDADVVPPAEIAPVVQLLRTGKQRGLSLLEATIKIKKYPEQTRRFFGAHYTWVEQICRNYDMRQQFYDSSERQNSRDNDIRDKVMMSNFLFVLGQYPDEKFFGQFGSEHIYQQPCETDFGSAARSRFGTLLNAQNSPVHGQVCSIVYFYYSSGVQDGQAWNSSSDYFDFSLFSPWFGQNVFFPLDEPGSIFAQAPAIVREGAADNACAYFQKAELLSDSPRCTLYSSR